MMQFNINGLVLFSCMYCFEKEINLKHTCEYFPPPIVFWKFRVPYSLLLLSGLSFEQLRLLFVSISFTHTHTLFISSASWGFLVVNALLRRTRKLLHTPKSHAIWM